MWSSVLGACHPEVFEQDAARWSIQEEGSLLIPGEPERTSHDLLDWLHLRDAGEILRGELSIPLLLKESPPHDLTLWLGSDQASFIFAERVGACMRGDQVEIDQISEPDPSILKVDRQPEHKEGQALDRVESSPRRPGVARMTVLGRLRPYPSGDNARASHSALCQQLFGPQLDQWQPWSLESTFEVKTVARIALGVAPWQACVQRF